MGAGHTVTALYEIVPAGRGRRSAGGRSVEVSAPAAAGAAARPIPSTELMTVKVRYKQPDGDGAAS